MPNRAIRHLTICWLLAVVAGSLLTLVLLAVLASASSHPHTPPSHRGEPEGGSYLAMFRVLCSQGATRWRTHHATHRDRGHTQKHRAVLSAH